MVRGNKDLVGVSRPQKIVEEFLLQQGFKRKGSKEEPVFRINIQDASTHQMYLLDIPFKEEHVDSEKRIRLGEPFVQQGGMGTRLSDQEVPLSIAWACESKLAELADYLTSYEQEYTSH